MGKSLLLVGEKKASDILLEYSEPLLRGFPADISDAQALHLLSVPIMIWNATSLEDAGRKGWVAKIFASFDSVPSEEQAGLDACVFYWIRRKVELFPNEIWCVRNVKFRISKDGEKRFRAVVSLPTEFEHLAPPNWIRIIDGARGRSA